VLGRYWFRVGNANTSQSLQQNLLGSYWNSIGRAGPNTVTRLSHLKPYFARSRFTCLEPSYVRNADGYGSVHACRCFRRQRTMRRKLSVLKFAGEIVLPLFLLASPRRPRMAGQAGDDKTRASDPWYGTTGHAGRACGSARPTRSIPKYCRPRFHFRIHSLSSADSVWLRNDDTCRNNQQDAHDNPSVKEPSAVRRRN
jgi:hypothetical protein